MAEYNESQINSNETERIAAEQQRIENETKRQTKETEREARETTRQSNETTRISKEAERLAEEVNRVQAEASRVTAEQGRQEAENTRAEFYEGFSEELDGFSKILKEVAINVKDFGAKCDGITDDTEAINNAITYAIENQSVRTIIINGDCAVDSIIFSCNNKIIEGNGKFIANKHIQEFIQISGNGNIFRGFDVCSPDGITANYFIHIAGDDNIIEKCKVYRQTKIQANGMLWNTRNISITGNRNTLQNCESFNGAGGVGVSGKYNKILHCYIHDNIVGISCTALTRDCEIGHNRITNNNVVEDSGTDGILCTRNVSRMNIHHNTIHGNAEHGIYFQGDNSIICDNDVSFNAHSGIKLASYNDGLYFYEDETQPEYYVGYGNIVSNNQCNNNTEGIYLQTSLSDIVVSNNICARNAEEGIRTAYTSDTYTIKSLTIDNNRLYDNGLGMAISCDSDLKVTNNVDKASSTTIGGSNNVYLTHGEISGNHFHGRLMVSKTDNGRVVNNRINKLTIVSNNLGVYLIDNIIHNQDIDLAIDRVREMRGCVINFVDASLIAVSVSAYLKRINDCTLSFNGKSANYDYSIQLSKEFTQFDFSNNKITQSAESWRIANIKAVDSLILNNSIYCTNNTEVAFLLDISGSICNNNIIANSVSGISIRGNNNIVCYNRAQVSASTTYTGNIIDNNLTV